MEQVLWFGWFRADIIASYAGLFWRGLQMTILQKKLLPCWAKKMRNFSIAILMSRRTAILSTR